NLLRRQHIAGEGLLDALVRPYHRHNLGEAAARHATPRPAAGELPLIVCSEGVGV
ncbi:MAG: hypothetical protein GXP41_09475, partial [Chloroflexi bacterium]|nr:hypothetical protein [Chloroflexota bacterium]